MNSGVQPSPVDGAREETRKVTKAACLDPLFSEKLHNRAVLATAAVLQKRMKRRERQPRSPREPRGDVWRHLLRVLRVLVELDQLCVLSPGEEPFQAASTLRRFMLGSFAHLVDEVLAH